MIYHLPTYGKVFESLIDYKYSPNFIEKFTWQNDKWEFPIPLKLDDEIVSNLQQLEIQKNKGYARLPKLVESTLSKNILERGHLFEAKLKVINNNKYLENTLKVRTDEQSLVLKDLLKQFSNIKANSLAISIEALLLYLFSQE